MAVPALRALAKRWPTELLDAACALLTRRPGLHVAQWPMPRVNDQGGVRHAMQCLATVQVHASACVTVYISLLCNVNGALADHIKTFADAFDDTLQVGQIAPSARRTGISGPKLRTHSLCCALPVRESSATEACTAAQGAACQLHLHQHLA